MPITSLLWDERPRSPPLPLQTLGWSAYSTALPAALPWLHLQDDVWVWLGIQGPRYSDRSIFPHRPRGQFCLESSPRPSSDMPYGSSLCPVLKDSSYMSLSVSVSLNTPPIAGYVDIWERSAHVVHSCEFHISENRTQRRKDSPGQSGDSRSRGPAPCPGGLTPGTGQSRLRKRPCRPTCPGPRLGAR